LPLVDDHFAFAAVSIAATDAAQINAGLPSRVQQYCSAGNLGLQAARLKTNRVFFLLAFFHLLAKFEYRISKSETISKFETQMFKTLSFEFRISVI